MINDQQLIFRKLLPLILRIYNKATRKLDQFILPLCVLLEIRSRVSIIEGLRLVLRFEFPRLNMS